jgi:hypothetical protein
MLVVLGYEEKTFCGQSVRVWGGIEGRGVGDFEPSVGEECLYLL